MRLSTDEVTTESRDPMAGLSEYWGSFCKERGEKGVKLDITRSALVGGKSSSSNLSCSDCLVFRSNFGDT